VLKTTVLTERKSNCNDYFLLLLLSLVTVLLYLSYAVCKLIIGEVCVFCFSENSETNISQFNSGSIIVCTSFIPFCQIGALLHFSKSRSSVQSAQ